MSFLMIGHHHARPPPHTPGLSEAEREKHLAEQESRSPRLAKKNGIPNFNRGKNIGNSFKREYSKPKLGGTQGSSSRKKSLVSVGANMQNYTNSDGGKLFKDQRMDQSSSMPMSIRNSDVHIKRGKDVSKRQHLEKSDGEDWRVLSRTLSTRQKFSAISNRELMRLAELRFSNDMQEGDSGNEVLLLQKALFWLGYLSTKSDITGYFGTETKQALCEFQDTHGVNQTAIWSALSKQALWHTISGEILHRVADEKIANGTESNSDSRVQAWQLWRPMKFIETFEALGEWRLLSGIALLVAGVLFGLILSKYARSDSVNGKSMKRQIIRSSGNQNAILPAQQDKFASTSFNGAAVSSEKPTRTGSKNTSMKNMDIVSQINDAHAVVNKVVRDPLPQLKTIPTSYTFKRIGREALGTSTPKSTKTVSQESTKRPTSSKAAFDSSNIKKQSESRARSAQNFEKGEPKSSSLQTQDSSSYHKQNKSFNNSSLRDSNTIDVTSMSQRARSEMRSKRPNSSFSMNEWTKTLDREDEPSIKRRIEELHKAVEAAGQNGQAAVNALEEERKRSIELEEKISQQRECAAALEEEVRVLKESHDVLLESVRKKF